MVHLKLVNLWRYFRECFASIEKSRTFAACVFHSIRFKVNKGWVTAVTLFLYPSLTFSFAFPKQVAVSLHQFSYQQKCIDSHKAIAY